MLDVFYPVNVFSLGVANAQLIVKIRMDGDIDVLIDGGADHSAAALAIEAGKVAASAGEADAKWSARHDHRSRSSKVASPAAEPISMKPFLVAQALSCWFLISAGKTSSSREHLRPSGISSR